MGDSSSFFNSGDALGGEGGGSNHLSLLGSDSMGSGGTHLQSGMGGKVGGGRGRSSSLVTVTEVGGDDGDQVVDRLGVGVNENANWVNAPGEWGCDEGKERTRGGRG